MKENKAMAYGVWMIAFVVFNIIALAAPTIKPLAFWISYIFTIIAFILQIGIWRRSFKEEQTLKSKFFGLPLVSVGIIFLVIQIIIFAIFMNFPLVPSGIAIVVCVLVLGVFVIALIGTDVSKDEIIRVEEKIEKKVFYMKSLQVDLEMLADSEGNVDVKAALIKLAEKIKYSDPMSNESLIDLEAEIAEKVNELKTAENKSAIITVLDSLLTERNKKVKLLK